MSFFTNIYNTTGLPILFEDPIHLVKTLVMYVIIGALFYLAIVKKFEPLLLLPIAFGMLLANLPGANLYHIELFIHEDGSPINMQQIAEQGNLIDFLYLGVKLGIYPSLIFLGVGAMTDFSALIANPKSLLMGERTERFYVIALNAQCKVTGRRKISEGSLSEVSAYPRLVLETALNYNAHSVLLCHNHPGGTCAPSPEDLASTLQLQRLLNGVGILLLDHIIVANDSTYSMVQHGDIDYRIRNSKT